MNEEDRAILQSDIARYYEKQATKRYGGTWHCEHTFDVPIFMLYSNDRTIRISMAGKTMKTAKWKEVVHEQPATRHD